MSKEDPLKPMVYEMPPKYYEPKEYKKLKKKFDYDKERAEEYAEAATECYALKKRIVQLHSLMDENEDLEPFMWTTGAEVVKAHHQIDDDHLKNILEHLMSSGRKPSKELAAEMESRGLNVTEFSSYKNERSILEMLSMQELEDMRVTYDN